MGSNEIKRAEFPLLNTQEEYLIRKYLSSRVRVILETLKGMIFPVTQKDDEMGINHFIFRTHWAGMPLSTALQSLRLISDELLPELRKV